MTLEDQIMRAIRSLRVSGFKASIHNIWQLCTSDFDDVRDTLIAMEDANIISIDDAGNYIVREHE